MPRVILKCCECSEYEAGYRPILDGCKASNMKYIPNYLTIPNWCPEKENASAKSKED